MGGRGPMQLARRLSSTAVVTLVDSSRLRWVGWLTLACLFRSPVPLLLRIQDDALDCWHMYSHRLLFWARNLCVGLLAHGAFLSSRVACCVS